MRSRTCLTPSNKFAVITNFNSSSRIRRRQRHLLITAAVQWEPDTSITRLLELFVISHTFSALFISNISFVSRTAPLQADMVRIHSVISMLWVCQVKRQYCWGGVGRRAWQGVEQAVWLCWIEMERYVE